MPAPRMRRRGLSTARLAIAVVVVMIVLAIMVLAGGILSAIVLGRSASPKADSEETVSATVPYSSAAEERLANLPADTTIDQEVLPADHSAPAVANLSPEDSAPKVQTPALLVVDVSAGSKRVPLNGVIDEFCIGAEGRLIVLRLRKSAALTVYDVRQRRIVGQIPADDDPVCFAAGRHKLVVGLWGQSVIQRWDLETLQLEQERLVPGEMAPITLAMGSASQGPVLAFETRGKSQLIDLQTLESADIQSNVHPDRWKHYPTSQHRVSANGRLYCAWDYQTLIAGVGILEVADHRATYRSYDDSVGHVCPDASGTFVMTAVGRFRHDERPNHVAETNGFLVPAVNGEFFVRVEPEPGRSSIRLRLFAGANAAPLAILVGMDFPHSADIQVRNDFSKKLQMSFPPDRRLIVVPSENQLITIAADGASLHVYSCDFSRWTNHEPD